MAIRFDVNTDRVVRTASILNYNNPYTITFMFYATSQIGNNTYSCLASINTNSSSTNYDYIGFRRSGGPTSTNFVLTVSNTQVVGGTAVNINQWYRVTVIRVSATSLQLYLDGTLHLTNTTNVTGRTAASRMEMGGFTTGNLDFFDGRIAGVKIWTADLGSQRLNERYRYTPVNWANLHMFTPMLPGITERLRDYSNNGFNWTAGGTLTDEGGPPLTWGGRSALIHPFVLVTTTYNVSTSVSLTSTTPDNLTLVILRPVSTAIATTSTTPDGVVADIARSLVTTTSLTSTTSDTIDLTIFYQVATLVSLTSMTPDTIGISLIVSRSTAIALTSITPTNLTLVILRPVSTAIATTSTTPDNIVANIARSVSVTLALSSLTPDTVLLERLLGLVAGFNLGSVTTDIAELGVLRLILSLISLDSLTATDAILSGQMATGVAIDLTSLTPVNQLAVARHLNLLTELTSLTPDADLLIGRELASSINLTTVTSDFELEISHLLLTLILLSTLTSSANLSLAQIKGRIELTVIPSKPEIQTVIV